MCPYAFLLRLQITLGENLFPVMPQKYLSHVGLIHLNQEIPKKFSRRLYRSMIEDYRSLHHFQICTTDDIINKQPDSLKQSPLKTYYVLPC